MTVYVDDMRKPVKLGYRLANWSHMLADTPEELAAFAQQLGLKSVWLQNAGTPKEHYDVTDTVRKQALALGAQAITYRQTIELVARKKALK